MSTRPNVVFCRAIAAVVICGLYSGVAMIAQEPTVAAPQQTHSDKKKELFEKFSTKLTGCKFVGSFTVVGQETGKLTPEEYHIKNVQKMEGENMWLFTARIKYGKNDYSVPLPLQVLWAGDTPVITVSDFSILGQGPFSARVVIHDNKYSGTWSHGSVGGHLFGTIVPDAAEGVEVDESKAEDGKAKQEKSSDFNPKETSNS